MAETQTVIKVLRKARTPRAPLYSAIARREGIQIRYLRRKVNNAPDGRHFLAFDSLEAALTFASFHYGTMQCSTYSQGWRPIYDVEIWECKATGVKVQHRVAWDWDSIAIIESFWAGDGCGMSSTPAPPGTISCKTIKLVRKVA